MIWGDDISFEGFQRIVDEWYRDKDFELCDPPINAQYALDLIFKTLIDDKENYPYLTTRFTCSGSSIQNHKFLQFL